MKNIFIGVIIGLVLGVLGAYVFMKPSLVEAPKNESKTSEGPSLNDAQVKFITVVYPNGGEVLERGKMYTIRWLPQSITRSVQIRMRNFAEGANPPPVVIGSQVPELKAFEWSVPKDFKPGDRYKIGIEANDYEGPGAGPVFYDESDGFVTIR